MLFQVVLHEATQSQVNQHETRCMICLHAATGENIYSWIGRWLKRATTLLSINSKASACSFSSLRRLCWDNSHGGQRSLLLCGTWCIGSRPTVSLPEHTPASPAKSEGELSRYATCIKSCISPCRCKLSPIRQSSGVASNRYKISLYIYTRL